MPITTGASKATVQRYTNTNWVLPQKVTRADEGEKAKKAKPREQEDNFMGRN